MFEPGDLTPLFPQEHPKAWEAHMMREYKQLGYDTAIACQRRDPKHGATVCLRPKDHIGPHVNHWIVWLEGSSPDWERYSATLW